VLATALVPRQSSPFTYTEASLRVGNGQAILKSCKINRKECQDILILCRILGNKRVSPLTGKRQVMQNSWEKWELKPPSFHAQLFM